MQGTVSQIFYLGLHMNIINMPVKYRQNLHNIKREILDEKI